MITITFGTIPYSFDRPIRWIQQLLDEESICEPVFIQHGVTNVDQLLHSHPSVIAKPLVNFKELGQFIQQSRLVISHAGQGSTRGLASQKARFILVPRLAQYGEHIDDHQLLFAQSVEKLGVRYCSSLDEVKEYVLNPPPSFSEQLFSHPKLVSHLLRTYPIEHTRA